MNAVMSGLLALGMAAYGASATGQSATTASAAIETRPPQISVAEFARANLLNDPKMSPDGSLVAIHTVVKGHAMVHVLNPATGQAVATATLAVGTEYGWHRWAGSGIVLISVSEMQRVLGEDTRISRLIALKVSTGERWWVGPRAMGPEGDDLLYVAQDGSNVLLSFQKTIYDWPSVTRVSLLDQKDKGKEVQRPVEGVWEWYADDAGVVRMGTGWVGNKLRVTYRKAEGDRFREIARIGEGDTDQTWNVRRIVSDSDEAYLLDKDADGRMVLARYNIATREKIETIYRNESWDLTDVWLDDSGKPYAVDFTDDRDRRVWLEPSMAKLQTDLEKALKADEVWVGSHARDKSRMLVFAGGETDPGVYYIYDAKRRALDPFATMRPDLDIAQLARPKPISYTARDGTKVAGYLTLPRGRAPKALPLIILPHGGPYGVRDKLRYDDEVQFLANRGYAVLQPNYRGSDGYGSDFSEKGRGQIGRAMQDDLDDAMDWAVKEGIADPERVCVVGASYGGFAAMWSVIRNPERYRCAASFAGVTDWKRMLRYDAKFFSRSGARNWTARVRGEQDFDLDTVAPAHRIAGLKRPLLVAHGKRDTNVPFSQYKQLLDAASKAGVTFEQMVFEEAGHGFDTPEDEARWLGGLERFLATHNPAD